MNSLPCRRSRMSLQLSPVTRFEGAGSGALGASSSSSLKFCRRECTRSSWEGSLPSRERDDWRVCMVGGRFGVPTSWSWEGALVTELATPVSALWLFKDACRLMRSDRSRSSGLGSASGARPSKVRTIDVTLQALILKSCVSLCLSWAAGDCRGMAIRMTSPTRISSPPKNSPS